MGFKSILFGVLSVLLIATLLYGINTFAQKTKDEETLFYGVVSLFIVCSAILYAFVWTWNNVRTWTFYLVFIPLFAASTFDFLATLDLWREPNGIFLTEYIGIKDRHIQNVVFMTYSIFDGTFLQAINFAALCRLGSGKSSRDLLIISGTGISMMACIYVCSALSCESSLHPLTKTFLPVAVASIPFLLVGALRIPRNFFLSNKQGSGIVAKVLALITLPLLVAAGAVFVAKAMVLSGLRNEFLDIVRLNDPLIFLNDVEDSIPFIAAVIWQNIVVSLPILTINLIYHFKSAKPTMLWDLSIVNLTIVTSNQFNFLAGSFYWKTPKSLQVNPANTTFWIINLIPIVGAVAQVVSLLPFKSSLVSVKAKAKKWH